jgi:transposase
VTEEFVSLPDESLFCPICGKPVSMMSDTEDSEVLEIDVRAHRRRIRRRRYRVTCDCDPTQRTLTAPSPPKLIPKGNYGVSIWVLVLLDKYSSYRPTERLLGQLEQYDLDLPAGTINDGLQRIEPMLCPIYDAFCERNRQGDFHQADETRWLVFVLLDGKKGYGWWLWVVLGADTVVYLLDPSRGHEVPESHFGSEASGVLEVDRYSGYKAMAQVKSGLLVLAFCWAHVRRDFVGVGKSWSELTPWALEWLRRIRHLYQVNRERLQHPLDSAKYQEQDALLCRAVEAMRVQAVEELSNPKLRQPCRKVLESLQEHWLGLTRFVEDSRIPMDNNASERAGRGPAVARKNFYGSGSLWSGRLAATMFSLLTTLAHWKINPRLWLLWYLESCAAADGKAPNDIQPFLPWNLSPERHAALAERTTSPSIPDTS